MTNDEIVNITRRIDDLYYTLEPEHLTSDGHANDDEIAARRILIRSDLDPLLRQFKETFGFEPDETDSYDLSIAFAKSARDGMNAIGRIRQERKLTSTPSLERLLK